MTNFSIGCLEWVDADRSGSGVDMECKNWQGQIDLSELNFSESSSIEDMLPLPVIINNSIPLEVEEINPVNLSDLEINIGSGIVIPEIKVPEINIPQPLITKNWDDKRTESINPAFQELGYHVNEAGLNLTTHFINIVVPICFVLSIFYFIFKLFFKYKNRDIPVLDKFKDSDNINSSNSSSSDFNG